MCLLILSVPLLILIALAIKLDSRGSILYYRYPDSSPVYRVGQHGQLFHYFKFRTMIPENQNRPEDVTRVGNFLRRYHLDELPELLLVISGRMSLVGPRPLIPREAEQFLYYHNLAVKPGMTGPTQLYGGKIYSSHQKAIFDLRYIKDGNLWADLKLLAITPLVIFQRRHEPHIF
jgi:lipopolysaccharide/colanic/teichoic acid biosynthesis glycosyltransferase